MRPRRSRSRWRCVSPTASGSSRGRSAAWSCQPRISLAIAASLGCLTLLGGVSLWQGWSEARNDLRQERNLRLLEGIRSLGTTPEASISSDTPATPAGEALPPPPPNEAWIEELGQLEAHSAPSGAIAPLQVPLNGTLQAPAPPASATAPIATRCRGNTRIARGGADPGQAWVGDLPGWTQLHQCPGGRKHRQQWLDAGVHQRR